MVLCKPPYLLKKLPVMSTSPSPSLPSPPPSTPAAPHRERALPRQVHSSLPPKPASSLPLPAPARFHRRQSAPLGQQRAQRHLPDPLAGYPVDTAAPRPPSPPPAAHTCSSTPTIFPSCFGTSNEAQRPAAAPANHLRQLTRSALVMQVGHAHHRNPHRILSKSKNCQFH